MKKIIDIFLSDYNSDHIIMTYLYMHSEKEYFIDLENIYNQVIKICTKNKIKISIILPEELKNNESYISYYKNSDLNIINYDCDDIWIRDYCPKVFFVNNQKNFINYEFNAYGGKYPFTKDNNFKSFFTKKRQNIFLNDLVIEGGNIELSANGTLLTNIQCIEKNNSMDKKEVLDQLSTFRNKVGIKEVFCIESEGIAGDDTNGHIDNLIRFVNDETLVYMSSNDKEYVNYHLLKEINMQLEIIKKKSLSIKNIIKVNHNDTDTFEYRNCIYPYSKLNFLLTRNNLILPALKHNHQSLNNTVDNLRFKNISYLECEASLKEFGGLHCLTANL